MVFPSHPKDANEIAGPHDMTWCPDPPVYVPMSNLTEKDKETVRLACYKPEQNASLLFVDANPNYNIRVLEKDCSLPQPNPDRPILDNTRVLEW